MLENCLDDCGQVNHTDTEILAKVCRTCHRLNPLPGKGDPFRIDGDGARKALVVLRDEPCALLAEKAKSSPSEFKIGKEDYIMVHVTGISLTRQGGEKGFCITKPAEIQIPEQYQAVLVKLQLELLEVKNKREREEKEAKVLADQKTKQAAKELAERQSLQKVMNLLEQNKPKKPLFGWMSP